jgi:hypothetical protein
MVWKIEIAAEANEPTKVLLYLKPIAVDAFLEGVPLIQNE